MKKEFEAMVAELEKLTSKMDVPEFRRRNAAWLSRNMAARNANHPNYPRAREIVVTLISNGITAA